MSVAEIVQMVKSRQQQVRTVDCTWSSVTLYPKGPAAYWSELAEARQSAEASEATVQDVRRLVIDGDRMRFERRGPMWNLDEGRFEGAEELAVFADGRERLLFAGRHGVPPRSGSTGARNHGVSAVHNYPVLMAYRLFDPVFGGPDPEQVELVGNAIWEGQRCVVIEHWDRRRQGAIWDRWWLAEDLGYRVVHWRSMWPDGKVASQVTMQYERDKRGDWRLVSWDLQFGSGPQGEALELTKSKVTRLLLNEPVPPSEFELEFPPGTTVYDGIEDIRYVVGEQREHAPEMKDALSDAAMEEFVENVRREHLPAEGAEADKRVAPAEQPKAPVAPPVEAVAPPRRLSPYYWLLIGCGVVLLVVAAGAALARRKAAR